jgi:hypothetical protein
MEPKYPDKRLKDMLNSFKNVNYSFTVPVGTYKFNLPTETVEQALARLDEVDETVDAMTSYPQAKKMLDKVYGKL